MGTYGVHMVTNHTPGHVVAGLVQQTMETRGVTVLALSETTSIPRTTLIRRLSGKTPFTLNELSDVAAALGTTPAAILAAAERAA